MVVEAGDGVAEADGGACGEAGVDDTSVDSLHAELALLAARFVLPGITQPENDPTTADIDSRTNRHLRC